MIAGYEVGAAVEGADFSKVDMEGEHFSQIPMLRLAGQ